MSTLTTSTKRARSIDAHDEVARRVLQLKDIVAFRETLEARGATATELDENQHAIDQAHWRLAEAVKRRLTTDWRLTSQLTRRVTEAPSPAQRASGRPI